jgi:hypothetical protein
VPISVPPTIARRQQRQLRGPRAARLQHEDRAGEAEQADPEVAPQPELVEQAERARDGIGEGVADLGVFVGGDGLEGLGSGGRHACSLRWY